MFTLHTIENPYKSLKKGKYIPLDDKGIDKIELDLQIREPHELNLTINQELEDIYDFLAENDTAGIRIDQDDGLSLAFVKRSQGAYKDREFPDGRIEVKFYSAVFLLKNPRAYGRNYPIGFTYAGRAEDYFKGISSKLEIDYQAPNYSLEGFYPNVGSTFDLLEEGVEKLGNLTWRDLGITTTGGTEKVYIEVSNAANRPIDEKLLATNLLEFPKTDPNLINISNISRNSSGEVLTHVRPIGDRGSGGDVSSTFFITDKVLESIEQEDGFPLVPSGEYLANGSLVYDVANAQELALSDTELGEVYVVSLSNTQQNNEPDINEQSQTVYNRAVNFLKGKEQRKALKMDCQPNKIILPGTRFRVRFASPKQREGVFQINNIQSLGSISYSSDDLVRMNNI